MAQPERVAVVGDDQVEAAIGCRVEIGQRGGGIDRIGVVERFEHEFAARAQPGLGAERAVPVQHRGGDAPIIDAEPGAAGEQIDPGDDFGRSGQCRPGGFAGRSIISSRLAPITTGQSCSGRRRITRVHI